jgi:hypothetical protein
MPRGSRSRPGYQPVAGRSSPHLLATPTSSGPMTTGRPFLDIAATTGCRLIYAYRHDDFTNDDLRSFGQEPGEIDDATHAEVPAAVEAARSHIASGAPARIEVSFAHAGVVHRWAAETSWLAVLDEARGTITDRRRPRLMNPRTTLEPGPDDAGEGEGAIDDGREERSWWGVAEFDAAYNAELARLEPITSEWATMLSEHDDYIAAKTIELRRSIARRILPELGAWTAGYRGAGDNPPPISKARWRAGFDTLDLAESKLQVVKTRRVTDATEHADAWLAALLADPEVSQARTAAVRKRRAGDFVAKRLGFPSADLRDHLLSLLNTPTVRPK